MSVKSSNDDKIIFLAYNVARIVARRSGYSQGDAIELTMLQLRTLTILSEETMTMYSIASELQIKLPTASILIARLYDQGMVARVADKKDRRIVMIKITAKGKKVLAQSMESRISRVRYFLNEMSKQDKDALFEILNRLYKKIGDVSMEE
jgi:DNA-binding MarR family transcriptional regulator